MVYCIKLIIIDTLYIQSLISQNKNKGCYKTEKNNKANNHYPKDLLWQIKLDVHGDIIVYWHFV